jgi:hypothetical protein
VSKVFDTKQHGYLPFIPVHARLLSAKNKQKYTLKVFNEEETFVLLLLRYILPLDSFPQCLPTPASPSPSVLPCVIAI